VMPDHPATATPLALALAMCAIAPAAASARLDLNPAARTTSTHQPAVRVIRISAPGGLTGATRASAPPVRSDYRCSPPGAAS
jgi:hypothetical protein